MDGRQRADLDRHITGNYGEDSVPNDGPDDTSVAVDQWHAKFSDEDPQDDEYWNELDSLRELVRAETARLRRKVELGDALIGLLLIVRNGVPYLRASNDVPMEIGGARLRAVKKALRTYEEQSDADS